MEISTTKPDERLSRFFISLIVLAKKKCVCQAGKGLKPCLCLQDLILTATILRCRAVYLQGGKNGNSLINFGQHSVNDASLSGGIQGLIL